MPDPDHAHVDVFGSAILDRDTVLARHGAELAALVRAPHPSRPSDLAERLRAEYDLAFAEISIITYYPKRERFVTVDLVDAIDRERRMPFFARPTDSHPDPDGLIALWAEYEAKLDAVRDAPLGTTPCPFWHCLGFEHPTLVPYRDQLAARVAPREAALATILRGDRRDHHRAFAAFLLAHLASGDRVVEASCCRRSAIRRASSATTCCASSR